MDQEKKGRAVFEEIAVAGYQLVEKVKELAREEGVRQLKREMPFLKSL